MPTLDKWISKGDDVCASCGNKDVHIKSDTGKKYCMSCWHEYPEGFKTTGWNFI